MRRGRSTQPPNKEDVRRFERIRESGCIACRMRDIRTTPEIHHLTKTGRHGGKRRGHQASVGLCSWHHRGEPLADVSGGRHSTSYCEAVYGPSLAKHAKRFRLEFGEDDVLLEYQERMLARVA